METGAGPDQVTIKLIDNGVGFDVPEQTKDRSGRGLQNLQRRAATLQGKVVVLSVPGETTVTLTLPRMVPF